MNQVKIYYWLTFSDESWVLPKYYVPWPKRDGQIKIRSEYEEIDFGALINMKTNCCYYFIFYILFYIVHPNIEA